MIVLQGVEYGTAQEIADQLGPDITPDTVRRWADRGHLARYRLPGAGRGTVVYPAEEAALVEARMRGSRRGRPRALDTEMSMT